MPVQRAQLGGMFGSGVTMQPTRAPDYGAMFEGLANGASSLLHGAYLRKLGEQNRQAAIAQQQAQRAAEQQRIDLENQRVGLERQRLDAVANKPVPPRTHYDAARGVIVNEDTGEAHPIAGLPPAPTKEGAAHYDESRGVFVHPDGTVTKPQGLPAPIETPAQRRATAAADRAAASSDRAASAALLHERNVAVDASKGALDEAVREVPRPSLAAKTAEYMSPSDRQAGPRALQAATRDSLAYEKSTLQPARLRYQGAVNALVPSAAPAPAPVPTPTPRLRTPGGATASAPSVDVAGMQSEMAAASTRYQQHLRNPAIPKDQLRAAYSADLQAISKKYGAMP